MIRKKKKLQNVKLRKDRPGNAMVRVVVIDVWWNPKKKINEFRLLTGQFAEHHDGGRARDIDGFGPFGGGRRRLGPKRGVGHHRVIVIVDRGGRRRRNRRRDEDVRSSGGVLVI